MQPEVFEDKINKLIIDIEVIKTQIQAMIEQNVLKGSFQEKRLDENEAKVKELDVRLTAVENKMMKYTGIAIGASSVISLLVTIITKLLLK